MVASVCASAGPADGGARRKKRPVVQEVKKAEGPRSHASVAAGRTVLIRRPRQKARGKRGKTPGLATSQAHLFLSLPKPTGSSRRRRKKGNRDKNQKLGKKRKTLGATETAPERKRKGKKMASCSGSQQDDECCPITLVPFRTITAARTTFLPCCHRFDSDAIRQYIDNCLARRAPRGAAPPVPCPVCRCRVPPDYLADMGVPVAWPPTMPVVASAVSPTIAANVAPAPAATRAAAAPATATAPMAGTRRSSRPSRPPAPVVIVLSDGDDSEEAHERTAQWIDSDDDDDEDEDDDDSTGSLDEFIVDDDETDPDADYTPVAAAPTAAAATTGSGPAPDDDDDDDDSDFDDTDSDCSCVTDSDDI